MRSLMIAITFTIASGSAIVAAQALTPSGRRASSRGYVRLHRHRAYRG